MGFVGREEKNIDIWRSIINVNNVFTPKTCTENGFVDIMYFF